MLGFACINSGSGFPGFWALMPTIGTILLIAAGPNAWINRVVLSNRLFVGIGLISYPFYLWHWPLFSFARITQGGSPSVNFRMILVCMSLLLAFLTYRGIEVPLRNFKDQRKIRGILVSLMIILGLIGLITRAGNGLVFRSIALKSKDFSIPIVSDFVSCKDDNFIKEANLNYCLMNPKAQVNAAIIGDSHAEDKFYGLVKNDKERNWMLIGNSSCPPTLGIDVEADQLGCRDKFAKTIEWLVKNKKISTVVLSFYGNYFLDSSYAADHIMNGHGPSKIKISSNSISSRSRAGIFFFGLDQTIQALEKSGKKVLLLIDIPELPFFPRDCVRVLDPLRCQIERSEVDLRQSKLRDLILNLNIKHPSISVFDPIKMFCSEQTCSYRNGESIYYRDSHHLNKVGSDIYAKYFLKWLKNI